MAAKQVSADFTQFEQLYHEFETMELPALVGSEKQIAIGEQKRGAYRAMVLKGHAHILKSKVTGPYSVEQMQNHVKLLKTRTSAGRW